MNLSIVDNDRSPYSTRLVQKVEASEYFHLIDVSNNYQEAMQCIEKEMPTSFWKSRHTLNAIC